jgi:HAE1 family hydrophobic/amphiphilic exporter-1
MFSKFFIERPVLANVLAILIVVLGLVAMVVLPVAQYPEIVPPTVQVTTRFPGASARDVMNNVALPIEQQVNGVQDMLYMQSTSASDGTYTLIVTFAIGTDLNFAQVLVQNRVSIALPSLPQAVQLQGVTVQKVSTAILQIVTLTGDDPKLDDLYLANYATINLQPELARLPGVGQVNVFGAGQYAMRVWLEPDRMYARGLTPQDVVQALQQQSQPVAAGQIGAPPAPATQPFQLTLNVAGQLDAAEQFGGVIVKTQPDGSYVRVRDVGRVELGAQTYSQVFTLNGKPAAGMAVYLLPGANALAVAKDVRARMVRLAGAFPQGLRWSIPFDTTTFVNTSIQEVYKTLIEAGILVLVVILAFLQDWRATLVPATTVPVTIIGAFAAMLALGFTVNLSTLFALVLAIGIVVDDAIVIVEGASQQIERGLSPHDAAIEAMRQLLGPVIGITLVLMAVFLPSAFLPGLSGRMYAQFAIVIAATALISAVNAATLKPTQCALWLRPATPPAQRNLFYRGFNATYAKLEHAYVWVVGGLARHSLVTVPAALVVVALSVWGVERLPTGFLPLEDQGYFIIGVQLPDGASLGRTQQVMDQVQRTARAVPGVEQVVAISGISVLDNSATLANGGVAYVILKDWSQRGRGEDLRGIYTALSRAMEGILQAQAFVLIPPAIQGVGNAGGFTFVLELRDGSADFRKLGALTRTVVASASSQSQLSHLTTSFRTGVPQLDVLVNRIQAEQMQVSVGDVFSTLSNYMGSTYVGRFNKFGRTFQVYTQADARFRDSQTHVGRLFTRSTSGQMVPLGTLTALSPTIGPALLTLYNLYPAATIIGVPAQGVSSGDAMSLMEQIGATLPPGTAYDWTAMSYQEKLAGGTIILAFGLAMLLVYLVLAGQYESWLLPFSVILAVPLALLGPAVVLGAVGAGNNLYTQIGLILLVALAAKNAILIVEVAREARLRGVPIVEAAIEGARLRLRPILMTSFAFILGMVPLVIATGAGANARKSIGVSVVSGMLASTLLAVLFVPSFYVVIQRLSERNRTKQQVVTSTVQRR